MIFIYANYIGLCCMKLFQRLLGGASSSNGLFVFLCFSNPMFSENEFELNAVCTEAVHSVALGTRVTLQVWTCVQYVPKQSIP